MIEFLKSWVLNIVTLVVFIVLLEILVPNGKIKKFVNLTSGFILIIAIINPLLSVMNRGIDLKSFHLADSNWIDRQEIQKSSQLLEEKQMKQVTEVYRKKIILQIEERAKEASGVKNLKADVILNEDYQSASFGDIKRVYLILGEQGNTGKIHPVAKVEKVLVGKGKSPETAEQKEVGIDREVRRKLEESISSLFGLSEEKIVISREENQGG
jgi:stage III sporulation protein AF